MQVNHYYFNKFVWQFIILYDLSLSFVSLYNNYYFFPITRPVPLSTLWFYYAPPTNTLPFLFLESWITFPIAVTYPYFIAQLPHNKWSKTYIFSNLSLSLVTNTESQFTKTQRHSHKAKKKKKKKHNHKFTKTQAPQAQILRFWRID